MLESLKPHAREIILTAASSSRSIDPSALQEFAPEARVEPSLESAIAYARATAAPEETVLICGSLYLIGEARVALQ
jgi:folylpolyglutamate synthase/dihydropteroate synthase